MATPSREKLAKKLLQQQEAPTRSSSSSSSAMKKRRHVPSATTTARGHRLQQLPSPTERQLQQRESGWNDRFFYEQPLNSNKLPRADRLGDSSPSRATKDAKVRDERLQYGNSEIRRKAQASKQPANGRLVPLGHAPALAMTETTLEPSKAERLRRKALKAIDSRENALYQLNALILCTPLQETLLQPSRPSDPAPSSSTGFQRLRAKAGMALAPTPTPTSSRSSVMTNARDATRMAQKLAEDLQLAGIQCVEAMVEWMLEAGAKAEKPPPFVWRDRDYFVKMYSDLDFAQRALDARGVHLERFTPQNPLLVRPNQKLGRVLAAQAIITEMVELATARASAPTQQQRPFEPVDHGFERRVDNGDDGNGVGVDAVDAESDNKQQQSPQHKNSGGSDIKSEASADALILQDDDDNNDDGGSEPEQSEHEHEDDVDDASSDGDRDANDDAVPARTHALDASSTEELVHILDESLSDFVPSRPVLRAADVDVDVEASAVLEPPLESARGSARSTSEYDNSFDADDDGASDANDRGCDSDDATSEAAGNQVSHDIADDDESPGLDQQSASTRAHCSEGDAALRNIDSHDDNQRLEQQFEPAKTDRVDSGNDSDGDADANASDTPAAAAPETSASELLQTEVLRLARDVGSNATETPRIDIAACLAWANHDTIAAALERREPIDAALEGSFTTALAELQLSPGAPQTAELLQSSTAVALHLPDCLMRECLSVLDSVYIHVARTLSAALAAANSLVSEIDIDDAVEAAVTALADVDAAVWSHVRTAVALLQLAQSATGQRDYSASSTGISAFLTVFYPYVVHLPHEQRRASWRRVSHAAAAVGPRLEDMAALMDPTCKALLLLADAVTMNNSDDDDDDDEASNVPKLTVVCDRSDVLQTSVDVLWRKVFVPPSSSAQCVLYPFFESSFGEKVVDGLTVEEGEGSGPLKEWFVLVSRDMAATWTDTSPLDLAPHAVIEATGNKLVAAGIARVVQPGDEVSWSASDSTRVRCIVNSVVADSDTLVLDRSVATHTVAAADVAVRRPRHAFLTYVQASERFWLNAQTPDTPANRQVLRVYGWYLATALAHAAMIELALHRLVFELLLDATYCVTLDDVATLDATLYDALVAMTQMAPTDFAAVLELDGADTTLSVDAYVLQVVDDKFVASVAWQFDELRRGFQSVYTPHDLAAVGIRASDLATVICGSGASAAGARDLDFSISNVFRVALDPDFVACAPLQRAFWLVVNGFTPQHKRQFVQFVTGVDTLPLPGTEFLRIEMPFAALTPAEHEKTLHMLPQSHTCDNTLELPHYWRALCWKTKHDERDASDALEATLAEVLAKKLRGAIEYSSGYGLDGTSAVAGVLSTHDRRRPESASKIAESFDSLDLPAMGDAGDSARETERTQTPLLVHSHREDADELDRQAAPSTLSRRDDEDEDDATGSADTLAIAAVDTKEEEDSAAVAVVVPSIASMPSSPSKSARQHKHTSDDVDESYGEGDWEDEEELLE